ncbi:MAG: hydroxymethylbilane synthase [Rhodospirillales bacterium]
MAQGKGDAKPFLIGTRGSPLALAQAHMVRDRLAEACPELAPLMGIEIIKTTGDKVLDRALSEVGGKGLFTKEIDDAMLEGRIRIAVHSMKDVPTWLPDGIILPCMTKREDPRDVFISPKAKSLADLPAGAVVGTASLRRQAQILAAYPHLKVTVFRGNVQTRLAKLEAGEVDATLLALAGLNRLDLAHVVTGIIETEDLLPAVGQGAVGITCRDDDGSALDALARINDGDTVDAVTAERALLAELDGSCRTPIAGLADVAGDRLSIRGLVARPDGTEVLTCRFEGARVDAAAIGTRAGRDLAERAGPHFLDALKPRPAP